MVTSKFRPSVAVPMLEQNFTIMQPFQRHVKKLIPVIRSKTQAQLLSFMLHTLSLPEALPLPEGGGGTAWEPSKPELKKNLASNPLNVISLTTSPYFLFSPSVSACPHV
jgi:hypothetical protein